MWLSLHLYHADDPYEAGRDRLLLDGVAPLLDALSAEGLVERSFFVRYRDPDPHVRLRMRLCPTASSVAVVSKTRRCAAAASGFEVERDDMLREIPYVPELDRYGGQQGVSIAEEQFDLSSRVALAVLRDTRGRGRAFLLGRSILLSVILVRSFLDSEEASGDFLRHYSDSYGRHLPASPAADALASGTEAAPGLDDAVAALGRAWDGGNGLGVSVLDEWALGCRRTRSQLDEAGVALLGRDPRASRWDLLSSYLHMHHNRLGLGIAQEVALTRKAAGALARRLKA